MKISNWTFLFPVSLYFMPNVWDICSFLLLQTIHNEHTCIELCTRVRALGLPGGASGKEPTRQCRRHKRPGFDTWVGKIPWRRAWQPTPVFLPGESYGQRSLAGYSPWGCRESDTTEWHSMHTHTHTHMRVSLMKSLKDYRILPLSSVQKSSVNLTS